MEIQDVGLPGWTLQLPNGMVLKMGSAQGVLIIPDQEPEEELPFPTQEQIDSAVEKARKTLGEMQAEEIAAAKRELTVGLNEDGEYEPTDLRHPTP
jgi:hypothetical protein